MAVKKFEEDIKELEFLQTTAKGILNKDIQAYRAAIDYYEPFNEISELGSKLDIEFHKENGTLDLCVNGLDIIPIIFYLKHQSVSCQERICLQEDSRNSIKTMYAALY